jgi:hypothetical protein
MSLRRARPIVCEPAPAPMFQRSCRVCGCTTYDCSQCMARTGFPCWWVEPGLCSACQVPSAQ